MRNLGAMKCFALLLALLAAVPLPAQAPAPAPVPAPGPGPHWTAAALADLHKWIATAPDDALPAPDASALEAAERVGDAATLDKAADALTLKLATMHLTGCCGANHAGWHIADTDRTADLPARIAAAVAGGGLDALFAGLAPKNPDYAALRAAYAAEKDPARRTTLARNMERWRWLPQDPGQGAGRYLLVNTAAFEVRYFSGDRVVDRRVVINGKVSSPTPVFAARVTGITFNPWWDIPPNIVREGIGRLAKTNPAAARAKGYVWSGGKFRQRPGPGNSLGLMKLVMPNPFNIYLHDTPSKNLFARPVRAFSHGCIRVSDALGFASVLLAPGFGPEVVNGIVAKGDTTTVGLPVPMPVYIAYFTAGLGPDGQVAFYPDLYQRDGKMGDMKDNKPFCAA